MKINISLVLTSLLSTSLFAGFENLTLNSNTHSTSSASKNSYITVNWAKAIATDGDTLAGYYYLFDSNSDTLIPNVKDDRKNLSKSATEVTSENLSDGSYYMHIAPFSSDGDIGATAHFGAVKIDSIAPTLTISPNGKTSTESINVTLSANDANNRSIYYTLDGSTPTKSSTKYSNSISISGGTKTLKAIAIDSAGNESRVKSATFKVTSTGSSSINTAISGVGDGDRISTKDLDDAIKSLTISGNGVTGYKYKFDSNEYSEKRDISTEIFTTGLSEGVHKLSIIGFDGANWQSSPTEISFTVDNSKPTLSISPTGGVYAGDRVSIIANESATIYYTTDGSTPSLTNGTKGSSFVVNSAMSVKAIAIDEVGYQSDVAEASFTILTQDTTNTVTVDGGSSLSTPTDAIQSTDADGQTTLSKGSSKITTLSDNSFKLEAKGSSLHIPKGANLRMYDNGNIKSILNYGEILLLSNGEIESSIESSENGESNFKFPAGSTLEIDESNSIISTVELNLAKVKVKLSQDGELDILTTLSNGKSYKVPMPLKAIEKRVEILSDKIESIFKISSRFSLTQSLDRAIELNQEDIELIPDSSYQKYEQNLYLSDGSRGVTLLLGDAKISTDGVESEMQKNIEYLIPSIESSEDVQIDDTTAVNNSDNSLSLNLGWNLVALPTDSELSEFTKFEDYRVIWKYNENWERNPSKIEKGEGFWILVDNPIENITFEGENYTPNLDNLSSEWQLLGTGDTLDTSETEKVYKYRDGNWIENPTTIYSGEGFWVK